MTAHPGDPAKAVLGLGGSVDYLASWAPEVLESMVVEFDITEAELSVEVPIRTLRDLVTSIVAFVRDGQGGERFVASSTLVEEFARRVPTTVDLGGTCVRAAKAMAVMGVPSTVHLVSIDDHVRRLFPPACATISSASEDSTDPHLIVQFPRGARVRVGGEDIVAPRANRLIYVNDQPNCDMLLSDQLGPALNGAEVFLMSGLNAMRDQEQLRQRLADLQALVVPNRPRLTVVMEDAAYHVPAFARVVLDAAAPWLDVHSLNEDEMQAYVGHPVDLLDVAQVAAALDELSRLAPVPIRVVHTSHWAIAVGPGSSAWRSALSGAVAMAAARYVRGDEARAADVRACASSPADPTGAAFAVALEDHLDGAICMPAPRLAASPPTTVGLGDTFIGGFLATITAGRSTPEVQEHMRARG